MKTTKIKRERVPDKRIKLVYSSDKGRQNLSKSKAVEHRRGTTKSL